MSREWREELAASEKRRGECSSHFGSGFGAAIVILGEEHIGISSVKEKDGRVAIFADCACSRFGVLCGSPCGRSGSTADVMPKMATEANIILLSGGRLAECKACCFKILFPMTELGSAIGEIAAGMMGIAHIWPILCQTTLEHQIFRITSRVSPQ